MNSRSALGTARARCFSSPSLQRVPRRVQTINPTASGKPKKKKFVICLRTMCLFCARCSTAHRANAKWSGAMPSCDGVAPDHSIAIQFKYSGIKRPAPDSGAYSVSDSEQLKRVASSTHAGCKTTETGWPERVAPSMTTLKQLTS